MDLVAFNPDRELLASGSHNGTIKLWQISHKQAWTLNGAWIRAIALRSPTTDRLQLVGASHIKKSNLGILIYKA
ncbi:MAG: hypothetical protein AAF383_24360 [Cyanobacteria bacterium P01_A01_bin.83]